MKIRFLFILVLSIFIINVSNVYATEGGDDDSNSTSLKDKIDDAKDKAKEYWSKIWDGFSSNKDDSSKPYSKPENPMDTEDVVDEESTCEYVLGDPSDNGSPAYYIDRVFVFIKFLVPVILVVVSIFDYVKAIAASDGDAIEKTNKRTIKRLIFGLILFVLPIIISYLLTLLGVQGKCNFDHIPGL